jgi:hypothetical protein
MAYACVRRMRYAAFNTSRGMQGVGVGAVSGAMACLFRMAWHGIGALWCDFRRATEKAPIKGRLCGRGVLGSI